jgi:vacuolar-type H+-ATPase subunit H
MPQSALERIRDLDKEKLAIVLQAEARALDTISEALKELKDLATEHLKIRASARR